MPSPLGHALGGLAAGWLVAGVGRTSTATDRGGPEAAAPPETLPAVRRALVFALAGMAADLDLLIGRHSQFTHSIGAALVIFAVAAVAFRRRPQGLGLALAIAAAYASHILLDWLGQDATPPIGITALWPFSQAYYLSHQDIFWGISREPWRPGALRHDVVSIAREVALLLPIAAAAGWLRRPRGRHLLPGAGHARGRKLPTRASPRP